MSKLDADKIRQGNRRELARAITLVESRSPAHRDEAEALLDSLLDATGKAKRVGISGVPGVGKSTFIEALGLYLIEQGLKIAVLAVDPTSQISGGSILGDKTRMEELSRSPEAFIRPSPAGGSLGGVARRTREALLLCEAAGFDVILVETVGVGQSEVAVAGMVDVFCLLLLPGSGDELQGIKRGIVELADLLVINKADGDMAGVAQRVAADYHAALGFLRSNSDNWRAPVLLTSALENRGIEEFWQAVERCYEQRQKSGHLQQRRAEQSKKALWADLRDALLERLDQDEELRRAVADLEEAVASSKISPASAAQRLAAALRNPLKGG